MFVLELGVKIGAMRAMEVVKEVVRSEYTWDGYFSGGDFGFKWTALVERERGSKGSTATAAPTKRASGRCGVDKSLELIDEIGDAEADSIVKTGQEPSMQYLVKDLVGGARSVRRFWRSRPCRTVGERDCGKRRPRGGGSSQGVFGVEG